MLTLGKKNKKSKKEKALEEEEETSVEEEEGDEEGPINLLDLLGAAAGGGGDVPESRSIMFVGEVNEQRAADLISALLVLSQTKEKGQERADDIKLYISTYGGSADDMMSIYDMMRLTKKNRDIETIGMGKIMSAGTLILAAGTRGKRKIMKNCRVMIHAVSAGSMGTIHNLQNEMEEIQNIQDLYITALCAETLLTKRQLKKMLDQKVNVYLTAEEAVEYGLADEVI